MCHVIQFLSASAKIKKIPQRDIPIVVGKYSHLSIYNKHFSTSKRPVVLYLSLTNPLPLFTKDGIYCSQVAYEAVQNLCGIQALNHSFPISPKIEETLKEYYDGLS